MGLLLAPELERLVPTLPEACVVLVAYIAILVFPIVGRFHSLMRLYCLATLTPLFIMQLFQLIVPLVFPELGSRYFVLTTAINMYAGSQMLLCNSLLVKFVLERICDTSATYSDYRKMVILLSIIPAMPPSLLASQLSEETFVVVQIFNTILKVAAIIWECSMLIGLMRTVRGKHANMCDVSRADVYLLFTFCGCSTSITMLGYEASVGMDCAYEDTHDESTRILASDVAGLTCLGFPQWYFLVCRFKPAAMALCFLFSFPCFILNLFRLHARPLERSIFLGEEVHETYGDRRKSVRTMVGADADLDMASQLAQMRNANGVVNLAKMTATVHVSADSGIAEDVVEKGSLPTTRRGSDESNIEKLELPNPVHYQEYNIHGFHSFDRRSFREAHRDSLVSFHGSPHSTGRQIHLHSHSTRSQPHLFGSHSVGSTDRSHLKFDGPTTVATVEMGKQSILATGDTSRPPRPGVRFADQHLILPNRETKEERLRPMSRASRIVDGIS